LNQSELGQTVQTGIQGFRRKTRSWYRPLSFTLHRAQTVLRHLPDPALVSLERVGGLFPFSVLFWEATLTDLQEEMEANGLTAVLAVAQPPFVSNEWVLEMHSQDPRIIPVVNIAPGTSRPGHALKRFVDKGAKALKINPAADGEGVDSPRYKALLREAQSLALPVILHTGVFHSSVLYKKSELGKAELYSRWYETFPGIKFVLAHMNFHEPHIALDLAEEHPSVFVETSWQPTEMMGEAVRRIGAERVLFGSDWPFVGNNIAIGIKRIREAVTTGLISDEHARLILGENAIKVFGLSIN
jgi:predicted TIM-barrel fold metal-dependent hydrolase